MVKVTTTTPGKYPPICAQDQWNDIGSGMIKCPDGTVWKVCDIASNTMEGSIGVLVDSTVCSECTRDLGGVDKTGEGWG